jgi:hypothetical protein
LVLGLVVVTVHVPHAAGYFFLFDDFALLGEAARRPVGQILGSEAIGFYRPLTFLLLKAEFHLFGWDHPVGYATVSIALHLANAVLAHVLAWRVTRSAVGALVASCAFLLSPWSSEAFFWLSCQFDLVSTLGVLAALVCGLRALEAKSWPGAVLATTGTMFMALVALFAKEMAATLPILFAALVLLTFDRRVRPWGGRSIGIVGLLCLAVTGYLAARQAVFTRFGGAYGSWPELMAGANLGTNLLGYMRSVIGFPTSFDAAARRAGVQLPGPILLGGASAVLFLSVRFNGASPRVQPVGTWRAMSIAVATFLVSTLPVLWNSPAHGSTAGGRFLYLPGVWVSLLLGLRFQASWAVPVRATARTGRRFAAAVATLLFLYSLGGLRFHAEVWKASARLSQSVIRQFEPLVESTVPVYIENLPFWFIEGPYVLKEYAFSYYYGDRPVPPVRAAQLTLRYGDGDRILVRGRQTPGGEARSDERRVELVLDFRK